MAAHMENEGLALAMRILHYAYPPLVFTYFITASLVSVVMLHALTLRKKGHNAGDASLYLIYSLTHQGWWGSQDRLIYDLSSTLVWGILATALSDSEHPVWYPYHGAWLITLPVELALFIIQVVVEYPTSLFDLAAISIQALRISLVLLLIIVYLCFRSHTSTPNTEDDEESQLLLPGNRDQNTREEQSSGTPQPSAEYGTINAETSNQEYVEESSDSELSFVEDKNEAQERLAKRLRNDGNWWTYVKGFSVSQLPWLEVGLYAFYRWLVSGSGVEALKSYLWNPIEQNSYRAISTAAYSHIMNLSSSFHNSKESGRVYQAIDRGRSVKNLLETILFQIIPMLVDLVVAFAYFYFLFDAYMALIVGIVTVVFLWATTKLNSREIKTRAKYITSINKEFYHMYNTIGNWQTVSYFNQIPYEEERYSQSVEKHLKSERRYWLVSYLLGGVQGLIFSAGLLCACFLAAYQVSCGKKAVGDFVTLLSYWAQLSAPLNFFGNFYRKVASDMLNAERLLELLKTQPDIKDSEEAKPLELKTGTIKFEDVHFSYDPRKPAIKGIDFEVLAGQTVAFVGESGGGKSTILKLLFRFYDAEKGKISIDGQDIKDVTVSSLRSHLGFVPQDSTLFNQSIMKNLRYARLDASINEIFDACKAASIHNKIISFPEGYKSKVGERGVKLSGGELQRISIARAIIKKASIILLDEATSMVDTETESYIHESLIELLKGRTTLMIAHRLSTIVHADMIIVIEDGKILEQGTHDQLLEINGKYSKLWAKQALGKSNPTKPADPFSEDTTHDPEAPLQCKSLAASIKSNVSTTGSQVLRTEVQFESANQENILENTSEPSAEPRKHSRKSSKDGSWKPEAPEFIPRLFRFVSPERHVNAESKTKADDEVALTAAEKKEKLKREKEARKVEKAEFKAEQKAEQKAEHRPEHKAEEKDSKRLGRVEKLFGKQKIRNVIGGNDGADDVQPGVSLNKPESNLTETDGAERLAASKRRRRRRSKGKNAAQEETSQLDIFPLPVLAANASPPGSLINAELANPEPYIAPAIDESLQDKICVQKSNQRRRANSKSEPICQSDGVTDWQVLPHIGMGTSSVVFQRRVSATSDLPSRNRDMRGAFQGQRRRRHWRDKASSASNGLSHEGHMTSSSTDSPYPAGPSRPYNSPALRTSTDNKEKTAFASTSNAVHFAPGS
ncbi:MAG: hypothetical protein M1829_003232 [Trizodia sp. TS-e1964]|nr:MAG: hypothetical protein M1829_003232 [Trizodia sp. TS-e1964]